MSSSLLLDITFNTSAVGFVISISTEILLLVLILYRSKPSFGNYKYLMVAYNIILMAYSIATSSANLAAHSTETSYVLFRIYNGPNRTVGPLFILQFCTMYVTLLIILAVHFIYRYLALFANKKLWVFQKSYLLVWIAGSFLLSLGLISMKYFFLGEFPYFTEQLRHEFLTNYNLTMEQVCYNGPIYYICETPDNCYKPLGVWITMIALISCFVACLVTMTYTGIKCYYGLSNIAYVPSKITMRMHKQLLNALIIQAGIPIFCMYIPTALLLVSPMVGIAFGAYGNIAIASVSMYPPLDQIAIIYVIKDFRDAIKFMVCGKTSSSELPSLFSTGKLSN